MLFCQSQQNRQTTSLVKQGRWEGGFRMGNTCTPVVDSCQCMAKPIQYCKVISLQLNKFTLKNKTKQNQNKTKLTKRK